MGGLLLLYQHYRDFSGETYCWYMLIPLISTDWWMRLMLHYIIPGGCTTEYVWWLSESMNWESLPTKQKNGIPHKRQHRHGPCLWPTQMYWLCWCFFSGSKFGYQWAHGPNSLLLNNPMCSMYGTFTYDYFAVDSSAWKVRGWFVGILWCIHLNYHYSQLRNIDCAAKTKLWANRAGQTIKSSQLLVGHSSGHYHLI